MKKEKYKALISKRFSEKRYKHILGVVKTAKKLAKRWSVEKNLAVEAAFLHDYGKMLCSEEVLEKADAYGLVTEDIYRQFPELLHAKLGAELVRDELGVENADVLHAIRAHCYGAVEMSLLAKIIFIADYIEPRRQFKGVEKVRAMAFVNIDRAMLMALDGTIQYVIKRGLPIHPMSIHVRNKLINELAEG